MELQFARWNTASTRHMALMPPRRSGRVFKPVERFNPNIWPQRAPRRLWLTGSRRRGGMHRGKIVAARRLGNAWEYRFRWEGYGERHNKWLKRDLVSRGALQEFRARSRSCRSFRAFTVLLIGMLALGARYTPEMYTIGVNPLSELLKAHVTSWWLLFLIIISVLTFTDPARTSSDTPPVLVSARLPVFEGPQTVYIFHPASST